MKANSNNLLVAKLYTGYIASLAENGCISVPERYACDYRKQGVRGRVPRFIEENNGYAESVICDHERIYVGDPHGKRFLLFFCCRGAVPREVFDLVGKDPDSHHRQIALRQCHPCGHEYWRYGVYGACPLLSAR